MASVCQAQTEPSPPQPFVEEVARSSGRELKWPRQPYPGLRPFKVTEESDESLIFYGREEQKDEILARLNSAHVVYVIGPSGCGKSSLIMAGVLPALNAGLLTRAGHRWRCARMRPGRRPLACLAEVLAPLLPETHGSLEERIAAIDQLARDEDSALWLLADAMAARPEAEPPKRGRVLLIIDQFEELFAPEIESGEEVVQLIRLLTRFFERPHENLYLLLAMRTDYMGHCASYPHLAEMLNRIHYLIPVLTSAQLRVAITRPAEAYGGRVEPALVEALLEDMAALRDDHADQLPLLQHALFWLWEQAWRRSGLSEPPRPGRGQSNGMPELALEGYRNQGGLRGILNAHAETVFAKASGDGQDGSLCERVFKRLSERDLEYRYRRAPATLKELADATDAEPEAVLAVLRPFIAPDTSLLELLKPGRKGEELVDVSHESLIRQWDRLRRWADQEAEDVHYFRMLVESAQRWDRAGRQEKDLRTGGELEVVQKWWSKRKPSQSWARRYYLDHRCVTNLATVLPLVEEYRRACKAQDEKMREERESARRREIEALRREKKASLRLMWVSWAAAGLAVLCVFIVAGASYFNAERAREEKARIAAALGQFVLPRGGASTSLLIALEALGADSLPAVDETRQLVREALADHRLERVIQGHEGQVVSVDYRPDDGLLLTADRAGSLRVWDIADNALVAETKLPDLSFFCCRWSPSGERILASTGSHAVVFDFGRAAPFARKLRELFRLEGAGRGVFSADGRYILTGGFLSSVRLWNAKTGRHIREIIHDPAPAVAIDHESRRLAVATRDGRLLLYEVANLEAPPRELHADVPGGSFFSLAFHPTNPDILAAGSPMGAGLLWNLSDKSDASEPTPQQFVKHRSAIFSLAFSPGGGMIATGSDDRTVRLTDIATGNVEVLRGHENGIWGVAFAPSGRQVASASNDSTARVWNVEPAVSDFPGGELDREELIALAETHVPETLDPNGKVARMTLDSQLRCVLGLRAKDC